MTTTRNDGSDVIVRRWLDNHFYVLNANTTYQKNGLEIISGISYSDYINDHYGELIWGSDLVLGTSIRDRYYLSISDKHDFSIFSILESLYLIDSNTLKNLIFELNIKTIIL